MEICRKAEKRTTWVLWGGLAYMATQFGILARLTWWEYSWDIMEPVTYFITYGSAMAMYAYFVVTRQVRCFSTFSKNHYPNDHITFFQATVYNLWPNSHVYIHLLGDSYIKLGDLHGASLSHWMQSTSHIQIPDTGVEESTIGGVITFHLITRGHSGMFWYYPTHSLKLWKFWRVKDFLLGWKPVSVWTNL